MANRSCGYKNIKSESGEFSCHIKKAINDKLDIYCKVNGINKTLYVNQLVEKDMDEKFMKLKEANNE